MAAVFELDRVTHRFNQTESLRKISLIVQPGEKVALIGPSGAGKSTLLNLLNGTYSPSDGTLRVFDRCLHQLSGRQRRQLQRQLGTVYQHHGLITNLSVLHNVNAGHLGRWSLWKAAWSLLWPLEVERATAALAAVGIAEKLYTRADRLSGGQQQRAALARVLVQDPAVILADEPTASLDPERSREIMALLVGLCDREATKTLVMSLHDVAVARRYCDRIIGLRHGQLAFDLSVSQVTDAHLQTLYQL